MKEDFLHYLWKFKKFSCSNLKTTSKEEIRLYRLGVHNVAHSGPDFFNALISIEGQKWAGNVELHIKSSDWYAHHHEQDSAYDNVILHVVWEDNVEIFRKDNTRVPTLQLRDYVDEQLLDRYHQLFVHSSNHQLPCKSGLNQIPDFLLSNFQDRLFVERLEQKSKLIMNLLSNYANDWEAVFFMLLAKNFGLKINGDAFLSLAQSFEFSVFRKCIQDQTVLEALLFGQAGLLENESNVPYANSLQKEYAFLKHKFDLDTRNVLPFQFFRLRPPNFPTIRIAQLAGLYAKYPALFDLVVNTNTLADFYQLFSIEISNFWKNHYTFSKESVVRDKPITCQMVDLILINTVIPIRFCYFRSLGKNADEAVLALITNIQAEKNTIITKFKESGLVFQNALQSQSILQLRQNYCDRKACLKCAIGNYLLNQD